MNGIGEPFASEHSKKLIKEIVKNVPNVKFDFMTNGTLCTEKLFTELDVLDKIYKIRLSLNAASAGTYNKVVPNFGFYYNKIIDNLKFLKKLKEKNDFRFYLQMVVTTDNYKEIPKFVSLAEKYDAHASFWQFYPEICEIEDKNKIKYLDIFNPDHPKYKNLLKVIKDKSLDKPHVILSPLMRTLKEK